MGTKCCKEDAHYKVMLCKLSGDDLAVVAVANELEHAEAMKEWMECSVNID